VNRYCVDRPARVWWSAMRCCAMRARRPVHFARGPDPQRTAINRTGRIVSWLIRLLIRAYRICLSPAFPATCRFYPSCSDYAEQAIGRHGWVRGSWLAIRRLARCHPCGSHGFDPVP
jgi:putative membrane protein insertion efficiency factor